MFRATYPLRAVLLDTYNGPWKIEKRRVVRNGPDHTDAFARNASEKYRWSDRKGSLKGAKRTVELLDRFTPSRRDAEKPSECLTQSHEGTKECG